MSDLIIKPVLSPDASKLEVAYELVEEFKIPMQGKFIYVPKYFQFDGATIPAAAWQIIGTPYDPRFMTAAVAHDWLYYTHKLDGEPVERDDCDKFLHDTLIESGVNRARAWVIYNAVNDFGESHWTNRPEDDSYLDTLRNKLVADHIATTKYNF